MYLNHLWVSLCECFDVEGLVAFGGHVIEIDVDVVDEPVGYVVCDKEIRGLIDCPKRVFGVLEPMPILRLSHILPNIVENL